MLHTAHAQNGELLYTRPRYGQTSFAKDTTLYTSFAKFSPLVYCTNDYNGSATTLSLTGRVGFDFCLATSHPPLQNLVNISTK